MKLLIALAAVAAFGQTPNVDWKQTISEPLTIRPLTSDGILLASTTQAWTVSEGHDATSVKVDGKKYHIEVKYQSSFASVPATYPPGLPHYRAVFTVSRKDKEIAKFDGEYTGWRCFEDKPESLVRRALEAAKEKK